jgi:hypothetical protein
VALRFRAGTTDATKAALYADLGALRDHLDGILDFRTGTNLSPEDDVVRGFRDLFWFDFRDAAARDAYLADAAHRAIGARLVAEVEGGADGVFVIDFAA